MALLNVYLILLFLSSFFQHCTTPIDFQVVSSRILYDKT